MQITELKNYSNKYLRYFTKFHEEKSHISEHSFNQFRWCHIADFLKDYQHVDYIINFLDFLESNQMGNSTDFNIEEIIINN